MSPETTKMLPLADEATRLLKALAHPARLIICCQLKDKEMSVGDIETKLEIKQPRLSRELAKLREEGFLTTRRESKVIYYRLADDPRLENLIEKICQVMLGSRTQKKNGILNLLPELTEDRPKRRPQRRGGYGVFALTEV